MRVLLAVLMGFVGVGAARADASEEVCLRDAVRISYHRRPAEAASIPLTTCEGAPHRPSLDALSLVARAFRVERPSDDAIAAFKQENPRSDWVAPGVLRLHEGLLVRLQAIAERFPDREIEIVSGHRPTARPTSRHRSGRALDLRVEGIERADVAAFARSLHETGVGYYPNSTFTHVDVRTEATHWVDRSGPGEPADYGDWPPEPAEQDAVRREVLAQVDSVLNEARLGEATTTHTPSSQPAPQPVAPAPRIPALRSPERDELLDLAALRDDLIRSIDRLSLDASPRLGLAADDDVDWSVPW